MAAFDIEQAWEAHLEAKNAEAQEIAAAEARRERLNAHAAEALAHTLRILQTAGGTVELIPKLGGPYQQTATEQVPIGALSRSDAEGRDHGFAKVFVVHDTESVRPSGLTRRQQRTQTAELRPTTLQSIGVYLSAGHADGSNLRLFDSARWSFTHRYDESAETELAKLEARLMTVDEALNMQPTQLP
jgi:hypothetical protein